MTLTTPQIRWLYRAAGWTDPDTRFGDKTPGRDGWLPIRSHEEVTVRALAKLGLLEYPPHHGLAHGARITPAGMEAVTNLPPPHRRGRWMDKHPGPEIPELRGDE